MTETSDERFRGGHAGVLRWKHRSLHHQALLIVLECLVQLALEVVDGAIVVERGGNTGEQPD